MKTFVKVFLILLLSFSFISIQIVADEKKEELKEAEEANSCDMTGVTVPPYLLDSEINYKIDKERERRDSAPASFSWRSYMPPIRKHEGGAT